MFVKLQQNGSVLALLSGQVRKAREMIDSRPKNLNIP
jgi:hypothetical protein